MKKISKSNAKRWEKLASELRMMHEGMGDIVGEINDAIEKGREKLAPYFVDFNDLVSEAAEIRDEAVADIECYTDARSERWHEGLQAERYETWKEGWEQLSLEAVELPEPEDFSLNEDEFPDFDEMDCATMSLDEMDE